MMNKLHIRLINSKEYEENSENYDTNLNKNLIKFPVGALIEKLIEKCYKQNERFFNIIIYIYIYININII